MKQRMITVVCGMAVLILILLLYKTPVLNAAIAIVSVIAVREMFNAAAINKSKALIAVSYVYAVALPFSGYLDYTYIGVILSSALLLASFTIMLKEHETVSIEKLALCLVMTVLITASLTGLIFMRDTLKSYNLKDLALFYICLAFIGSWITDGGGYIFGKLFGRHKLSPKISPKKTIEGAVGGVVSTVAFSVLLLTAYRAYLTSLGTAANFNYLSIAGLSLLCAVVSIIGDLSASIIKRQSNIKDYGTILPGHGGIWDRFDSILFVIPIIVIWIKIFPVVY